jgi:8-oxo-dGTP pyrophosphatase MutT (NUDIX family)
MRYTLRAVLYKLLYRLLRVYWFIFRPEVRGTRCLVEREGQLLLIRQTYGDMLWTLPGGLIRRNESPEDAARREVKEEVGLEMKSLRPLGHFTDTSDCARDTVHCFRGETSSAEIKIDRDEIYEARWFDANELPEGQSRQLGMALELYSAGSDRL